jgi:hypothetical protein
MSFEGKNMKTGREKMGNVREKRKNIREKRKGKEKKEKENIVYQYLYDCKSLKF